MIRHASAVADAEVGSDEARYLSASGRQDCRIVGRMLRDENVVFDAMLTSPLVRAVQTAELLADATDYLGVIEAHPGLRPGAVPRVVAHELPTRGVAVAVIGHEPTISLLGAFLVAQPGFVPFRKCQVCAIENGKPLWTLRADVCQFQDLVIP